MDETLKNLMEQIVILLLSLANVLLTRHVHNSLNDRIDELEQALRECLEHRSEK